MKFCFSVILLLCFLSSCSGYKFLPYENPSLKTEPVLFYVPPIENDFSGIFLTVLLQSLAKKHIPFTTKFSQKAHVLKVSLITPLSEDIGFTYAPLSKDNPNKTSFLVPNESKLSLKANIVIINPQMETIKDTSCVSTVYYNFEPDLSTSDVHSFSLGQLDMHNLAIETASPPLYEKLAEEIIDEIFML